METDRKCGRPASRDGLATVPEAAEHLRLSRAKTYELMEKGELPYVKIDRSRRVRWSDLDEFIAARVRGR